MFKLTVLFGALVLGCAGVSMVARSSKTMTIRGPNGSQKMFVQHSSSSDLDSSASGYIYHSNGNQPATLVTLGAPEYHEPLEFAHLLRNPYNHFLHQVPAEYEHKKGSEHDSSYWSSQGEKGAKGYTGVDKYDRGSGKEYEKSHDSGYYDESEGGKKSHHDEASSYGSFDEGKKGESGESFSKKKTHKKGHKTTGYHNIYHKDEFKKQHSFFDEGSNRGHYDKYEKGSENYGFEKVGYKKGDHLDSAYRVSDYGKKGGFDKGSFSGRSKGFDEIEGGRSHFSKNSEYGGKAGKSSLKDYGFSDDSGFDHER